MFTEPQNNFDTLFQWGGDGCFNVFLYFQLTQELRNPIYFFIYLYFLRAGPRGGGGAQSFYFTCFKITLKFGPLFLKMGSPMDSHEFQLDPLFEMLGVHGPARRTSLFYPCYRRRDTTKVAQYHIFGTFGRHN